MKRIETLSDPALKNAIADYVSSLTNKGRKKSTIKRYLYDLDDFLQWVEKKEIPLTLSIWHNFVEQDYMDYFFELQTKRAYSEKTIHRMYVALYKFMEFLKNSGHITSIPMNSTALIKQPQRHLEEEDFLTEAEYKALMYIVDSYDGLSEKQLKVRPMLAGRNKSIFILLMDYGITLQELLSLQMNQINFHKNELTIPPVSGRSRIIKLKEEDKQVLYHYIQTIPEPVRPSYHSTDPLFVAFDFNRGTYRWVYETESPKAFTEIATQKMIRMEVQRAGLRKGISAQHFRNTYILNLIKQGETEDSILNKCGLKAKLTLKRYVDYAKKEKIKKV
ncbi:MAG: tyrosine-type recombinase/integrase [Bacillaceae bacterium]